VAGVAVAGERLAELLHSADIGAAAELCAEAVAPDVDYTFSDGSGDAAELRRTYEIRAAMAEKRGVPSIGGQELAARLSEEPTLSIGLVHGPAHNFAVFLDGSFTRCVAVWAITNDWKDESA
jgi:hypothetical protein